MAANEPHSSLSVPKLIAKKRDGGRLTRDEIAFFVRSVADNTIEGSQLGAMLMAIYLRGLDLVTETAWLTDAMCNSGERLKWPAEWRGRVGDKHSTGGIGDKVSIHLAPALAACGVKVPMVSGRGLGHTGGTVDKLESVPGLRMDLSPADMQRALADEDIGFFMAQQTPTFCPADRVMYRTRDVTSTVSSVHLVTASIMSKKLAEDLDALVLDAKLQVARQHGVRTSALLTDMNVPIGRCVGNSLELLECVAALTRPAATAPDMRELTAALGGSLLESLHMADTMEAGEKQLEEAIASGRALKHLRQMLVRQGTSAEVADALCRFEAFPEYDPAKAIERGEGFVTLKAHEGSLPLQHTELVSLILSDVDGLVADMDALEIGMVCFDLGSGRVRSDAKIDYAVGIRLLRLCGEQVHKGEPWAELHHRPAQCARLPEFVSRMRRALTISPLNAAPPTRRIVAERIVLQ